MSVQATSTHLPASADASVLPVAARRVAMLDRLAEMGMDLAAMVHRRGMAMAAQVAEDGGAHAAGGDGAAVADVTVAFDRVARAVRRTVSLARLLELPVTADLGARAGEGGPVVAARARVIRAVEDTIHRKADREPGDGERAESLRAELFERMDAPEFEDDLAGRPVEEVIREIERDLGIGGLEGCPSPWMRRSPAMVAALHARARGEVAPAIDARAPAGAVEATVLPKAVDWTGDLAGLALVLAAVPGRGSGRGPP